MIRISLKKHIFESVTDIMQCNIFTHGSNFTAGNSQFSSLSQRRGLIKCHDG